MENKGLIFYKSEFWVIVVCTICLQMPDLKLANIKISELLMLAILPFYIKEIFKSRTLLYFTSFFVLFLLKTFIFNGLTKFYINTELPFLKLPYFISASRFIELITCILFCIYIFNALRASKEPQRLIKSFLFVNIFGCGLFYIVVYLLYKLHFLHLSEYDGFIVYDTSLGNMVYRLKGFFVEGGPFGLFYAFLFTVCLSFYKKLNLNIWYLITCVILVLLASSKAGYLMLAISIVPFLGKQVYNVLSYLLTKKGLFILIGIGVIYIGSTSYTSLQTTQDNLEERILNLSPDEIDPNYMQGRFAACVIVPKMLQFNWIKGIGWGNYPIIRNNPLYRSFIPELPVSMWDSTGFGGIMDLFLEAGSILLIVYLLLYYRIIKLINKYLDNPGYIIISYICPLIFGGAIYLFYTWFLLGIILFLINNIQAKTGHFNKSDYNQVSIY